MIRACVFDAYGTLFDVDAAARRLAAENAEFAKVWPQVSAIWRAKQVGYSWHRAITGDYRSFWEVTGDALDFALEQTKTDPGLRQPLMDLYLRLDAYPEVPAVLDSLRAAGFATAILSNGSPDMLGAAVEAAGLADRLDQVLSVADVGVFKPAPQVYALAEARLGATGTEIAFFSSNGWDAAAAAAYGFTTLWVNRAGAPRERLGAPPAHELADLSAAAEAVADLNKG